MNGVLFSYDGELSEYYGLKICCFDGFESEADGGSTLDTSQVHIVGTDEFVIVNNTYSNAITYTFQVGKFDDDCNVDIIEPDEYSQMLRWLNRKEDYKLKFDVDKYENFYWIGRFNCQPVVLCGETYGIELTFTSKYPYAFQDTITQLFDTKEFTVYNNTDELGTTFMISTITLLESGDLIIENDMDDETTEIKNCIEGETITIDAKHSIITTSNTGHKLYDDFNWNYPKICSTYDNRYNHFKVNLSVKYKIEYDPVRKVGLA